MRADRISHFKERLRQGADNFEFSALIDGVSTLDEPAQAGSPIAPFVAGMAALLEEHAAQPIRLPEPMPAEPEVVLEQTELEIQIAPIIERPETLPSLHPLPVPQSDRLRTALRDLSTYLARQATGLGAALDSHDAMGAGEHLARLNHALDLLHSVDPDGEQARLLEIDGAPPTGRPWPGTAGSVFEFAESPFSGLLPGDAGQELVQSMIHAAWGVEPH